MASQQFLKYQPETWCEQSNKGSSEEVADKRCPSGKCLVKRRTGEEFEGKGTLNTDNYVKILFNLYVKARRKSSTYLPNVEESIKIVTFIVP